jgi:integrase/recombinase XerD
MVELRQRSGSERTPEEYARILRRFMGGVEDPAAVTPAEVHAFAYATGPSGREPSPSSVCVRLAAISGFYGFLRRMGRVEADPAADVRRPRTRDPQPRGLDAAELRRLLAAIPATPSGLRDRAIVLTSVLTGLRRSEVMGLRRGDLTRNGTVYYTVRAKGGTIRHRELPPPALSAIVDALEAEGRPLETLATDERIFPVTSAAFYANLRRYAVKADLQGVTPHVLRHSAAKLRRDNGASIEDVARLLGHRSLFTTARYLARLEGEEDDGWQAVADSLGV